MADSLQINVAGFIAWTLYLAKSSVGYSLFVASACVIIEVKLCLLGIHMTISVPLPVAFISFNSRVR